MVEAGQHRMASAVLGQRQLGAAPADFLRVHDLVGLALFQDPVLVDARAVCERIFANDRFAARDMEPAHPADDTRGFQYFPRLDLRVQSSEKIRARLDCHDDLFQGAVPRALADAIERPLDLSGTGFDRRQRICESQAQVVVAVDAQHGIIDIFYIRTQIRNQGGILLGNRKPDRVGNVDGRGSGLDGGFDDAGEKFRLRARAVLGREFDIARERFRQGHAFARQADDFIHRLFQFEFAVDCRRGQKDVHATAFAGGFDGGCGCLDILGHASREAADHRPLDLGGDGLDCLEIPVANHGKSRLDDIHVHAGELAGDFHFFPQVHARSGALLPIAQRGVKNDDLVGHNGDLVWRRKTIWAARAAFARSALPQG